jgi:hypothetical protein
MARKTKLTPETIQRITQAISMGATYELASKYGGIHEIHVLRVDEHEKRIFRRCKKG